MQRFVTSSSNQIWYARVPCRSSLFVAVVGGGVDIVCVVSDVIGVAVAVVFVVVVLAGGVWISSGLFVCNEPTSNNEHHLISVVYQAEVSKVLKIYSPSVLLVAGQHPTWCPTSTNSLECSFEGPNCLAIHCIFDPCRGLVAQRIVLSYGPWNDNVGHLLCDNITWHLVLTMDSMDRYDQ